MTTQVITLGGGCFWCLDSIFRRVKGVESVICGYTGGMSEHPTYETVCSGTTGHAEVIEVTFNSHVITLDKLLTIFFKYHDPTTLNRQGGDQGTQYRSAVFTHSNDQQQQVNEKISALSALSIWANPIVTEVVSRPKFHAAEQYHQDYFTQNPGNGYCQVVIQPKVMKLMSEFSDVLI
jgi:methionine-S-sulfoxide reductase